MTKYLRLLACLLPFAFQLPAQAEEQDVAAAVRGVVRVVLIASKGGDSYFVGHGTGFAIAPDKVLTNAHVVELVRKEPDLVLAIVPSQGSKNYAGKVIAFSPGNDLALVQINSPVLPVTTFYAGAVTDGQHVTAIGYPGSVDRAQGLDANQMVSPLPPVKTGGTISSGRSSQTYDTLLHTAPMAQGNSGGPLVDDCGRALGVNSFGSLSDSGDSTFGFAISNREVAAFLRQAGVNFQRSSTECRSIADLDAQEAEQAQQDAARSQAEQAVHEQAVAKARIDAAQSVITSRENRMALSAVLLALAVLLLGGAGLLLSQRKKGAALWCGLIGLGLVAGAVATFSLRPSFSEVDDLTAQAVPDKSAQDGQASGYDAQGDNLCRIDEARSRITISETRDVPLNWQEDGCVNNATQYVQGNDDWSRILVPKTDQQITINSFQPEKGEYRVERYLLDSGLLEKARSLRTRFDIKGCSQDSAKLAHLQEMQAEVRALLPAHPNERLVYSCSKRRAAVAEK